MNLPASNATALIRARGLTKTFGDRTAVAGIDFEVLDGEFFGFLGPNGAGKTTLAKVFGMIALANGAKKVVSNVEMGSGIEKVEDVHAFIAEKLINKNKDYKWTLRH